jgi:protein-disulfide isomerase
VKRIQKELGRTLRFVFRNFPITESHPRAEWAAETAEAAAAQGKFWPMHDFLYENQGFMEDTGYFAGEEERLNLDAPRIAREIANRTYRSRIEEDFESGVRSGVNGTPTFFINGVRYDGSPEFEPMIAALKEAQKTASARKK